MNSGFQDTAKEILERGKIQHGIDPRKPIDVEAHASDTMKLYNDVIELVRAAKYLDAYNKCKEYFDFSENEEDAE